MGSVQSMHTTIPTTVKSVITQSQDVNTDLTEFTSSLTCGGLLEHTPQMQIRHIFIPVKLSKQCPLRKLISFALNISLDFALWESTKYRFIFLFVKRLCHQRGFCFVRNRASSKGKRYAKCQCLALAAFAVCFLLLGLHRCFARICLCPCLLFIYRITARQPLLPFISLLHLLFPWVVLAIKPRQGYGAYKKKKERKSTRNIMFLHFYEHYCFFQKVFKMLTCIQETFKAHRYDEFETLGEWNLSSVFRNSVLLFNLSVANCLVQFSVCCTF